MRLPPISMRWIAIDLPRERAAIAAALGVDARLDGPIEIAGLRLEVVPASSTERARLELIPAAPGPDAPTGPGSGRSPVAEKAPAAGDLQDAAGFVTRFLALGWSTVDVDRAASSWPDLHWDAAPRDSIAGARALVGHAETHADGRSDALEPLDVPADAANPLAGLAGGDPAAAPRPVSAPLAGLAGADPVAAPRPVSAPVSGLAEGDPIAARGPVSAPGRAAPRAAAFTIVLLEPDTEGRIAASLARHGEGPAVLYVGVPASSITGVRGRLAGLGIRVRDGTGPFGPEWAIVGLAPSSATLVIVPGEDAGEAGEPARGPRPRRSRRSTIGR